MANRQVCSIAFQQALREKLGYNSAEIEKLRQEYFKNVKEVNAQFKQYKESDAYAEAVKQMMDVRKIRNIAKRRQAYKNLVKRLEMEEFILTRYGDNIAEGVDRWMQYVHYLKESKTASYYADLQRRLCGRDGFGEDYSKQYNSGTYDKLIWTELYYMDNPDAVARDKHKQFKDGSFTGDPIAYRLAQITRDVQRVAVQDAIDAGADIALIPGYMARQTHSADKFLSRKFGETKAEQKAAWKEFILSKLDHEKTFGDLPPEVTPDMMLDSVWDNITMGKHLQYMPEEISLVPGKNITKRAAQERKLFFKDGEAAYEYADRYGQNNLRESVLYQLENMANTTTLLHTMGTNPRYNFQAVFREIERVARETGNERNLAYLNKRAGNQAMGLPRAANNQLAALLGEDRAPGSLTMARINSLIRSMNNNIYLGGSLITAFMDLSSSPTIAHLQGRSYIGALQYAAKGLTGMAKDPEYRAVLESIGVISDAFLGEVAQKSVGKFSGDYELSRHAGYITNKFFVMNGLRLWTDSMRSAHTLHMSTELARMKNLAFNELNVNMKDYLKRFNISELEWDILRKHGVSTSAKGHEFMLNENIFNMPDKLIGDLYGVEPPKVVEGQLSDHAAREARLYARKTRELRTQLAEKVRSLLQAAGMESVLLPTVTEAGFAKQATSPGTVPGEILRHVMQFKQFPLALNNIILKGLAREAREAGSLEAAKTGAVFITGMLMMAYLSMTTKDLLNNRTPRDITDPQVFAEVVVRSGALSIYGDILLNDNSNSPYALLGTLLGPTASTAGELSQIASKAAFKGENVADDLAKFAINKAPAIGLMSKQTEALALVNLFYFKSILDYFVYNNINEFLNPGYLDRTRARLIKQDRDYLIQPMQ